VRLQLDLTHNHVGSDGALSLAFCLTRNTTLRRLILRHNLIVDAGCDALARALARAPARASLTELDVAANGVTAAAAPALGAMLAANTTLCRLDLSANALGHVRYAEFRGRIRGGEFNRTRMRVMATPRLPNVIGQKLIIRTYGLRLIRGPAVSMVLRSELKETLALREEKLELEFTAETIPAQHDILTMTFGLFYYQG